MGFAERGAGVDPQVQIDEHIVRRAARPDLSQPITPGTDWTTLRMFSSASTISSARTPEASRAICQHA